MKQKLKQNEREKVKKKKEREEDGERALASEEWTKLANKCDYALKGKEEKRKRPKLVASLTVNLFDGVEYLLSLSLPLLHWQ